MRFKRTRKLASFVMAAAMAFGLVAPIAGATEPNETPEPEVSISISEQPKLDVVLTLGQIEQLSGLDMTNFDADLKAALKARGVDVDRIIRIDKVETTEKDITSAFSWDTSSFFVKNTKGTSSSPDGISSISISNTNSGTNISMAGNYKYAGKNVMFATPLEDNQQNFTYSYNLTFGDSFNAAGMILRATKTGNVITGYMLSLNNGTKFGGVSGAGIWKFRMTSGTNYTSFTNNTNPSMDANGNLTSDGIKLVRSIGVSTSGTLNVVANSRTITISGGGLSSAVTVNIDKGTGTSFGFFTDHYSHGCSTIGSFTITNFRMEETSVKSFVDVLTKDVPDWEENSIRVIVNANQYVEEDFADADKLAYILSCCKNQDINYVSWGPSSVQSSNENFIKLNDGNGILNPGLSCLAIRSGSSAAIPRYCTILRSGWHRDV